MRKPHRQRGVGTRILQWLEKVADTAGIVNVFVQVRESNNGAIRFYERQGYHAVAEAAGYYQGRESAVILCKGMRPMAGTPQIPGIRIAGRILS